MMLQAIDGSGTMSTAGATTTQAATNAFGLSFDALLKIVLTQLTYQDPLKPMDNFEFVSQLAQFTQIQQGQDMGTRLQQLVAVQSTNQATGLLGKIVDIPSGTAIVSGRVTAVTFASDGPTVTIETTDGKTISNTAISSVQQVREGN